MAARRIAWRVLLTASAGAMWISCAKVGAPPGGPEDKTGPGLVECYPQNNTVFAPRRMAARLVFSEPVNRSSVEAALFLSPDPRQRVRYHWHGRTLELIYLDSLESDRTYVISVGSQARDLRGNPSGNTHTVAFSTGGHIDRGRIDGWIAGEPSPQAISVWAYQIGSDSANPAVRDANYRVQADKEGRFRFDYLKAGRYRLFAVADRNFDGRWNPPAERLGVPPWDVSVTDSTAPWVSFRLAEFDTLPARVQNVRAVHQRRLDVRFNRPVASASFILRSEDGDSAGVRGAWPDTSGFDTWHVSPDRELSPGRWLVASHGLDLFQSPWSDMDSVDVRERPDTTRPRVLYAEPALRATVVEPPDCLRIVFDEPIEIVADSAWYWWVVGRTDTLGATFRSESRTLSFIPDSALARGMSYSLTLDPRVIRDAAGNAMGDTSRYSFTFSVLPSDSIGALISRVIADDRARFLVNILTLRARKVAARVSAESAAEFVVPRLAAGRYLIEVIRDDDRNGEFSPGRITPFLPAEPFIMLSDTLTIRARWEQEIRIDWPANP